MGTEKGSTRGVARERPTRKFAPKWGARKARSSLRAARLGDSSDAWAVSKGRWLAHARPDAEKRWSGAAVAMGHAGATRGAH